MIELDGSTAAMLRTWKARQAEERLLVGVGYQDKDLIFCRPDGLPYHPEAFSKTFDRRLRQPRYAELPTIRAHDLRHTWATLAQVSAGVDVVIVSKRLGHGSPNTSWQTYQHVVAGMQTDAAEKVAALIFGPRNRHLKLVSGEGDDDQSGPTPACETPADRTLNPGRDCDHSVTNGPSTGLSKQGHRGSDLLVCVKQLARGGGLEPPMAGPEPAVLPITPPPKGKPRC